MNVALTHSCCAVHLFAALPFPQQWINICRYRCSNTCSNEAANRLQSTGHAVLCNIYSQI